MLDRHTAVAYSHIKLLWEECPGAVPGENGPRVAGSCIVEARRVPETQAPAAFTFAQ